MTFWRWIEECYGLDSGTFQETFGLDWEMFLETSGDGLEFWSGFGDFFWKTLGIDLGMFRAVIGMF